MHVRRSEPLNQRWNSMIPLTSGNISYLLKTGIELGPGKNVASQGSTSFTQAAPSNLCLPLGLSHMQN
ncbi:hypothetical protein Pmani_035456 [Petrolisthes manimaculis]|uniref:Uncharacterized protein n=1 Tax=Petrolisthes manimaculis TaxID=1843537 RepID=A0AAE1NME1_9EUCA|nr:hypothetical protein Pmani_035456 [Petrolisthes manimaculis]